MNRDDIIRMAREAGFGNYAYEAASVFERFAALVTADEREACARVCVNLEDADIFTLNKCASAIRARRST